MLLTQIMGKCCGEQEKISLGGQYYGLGQSNTDINYDLMSSMTCSASKVSKWFGY